MSTATKSSQFSVKNRRTWRRKKPRSTAKADCRKGTLGFGPNLALEILDISESGMGLILKKPVNPLDEVEVVLRNFVQAKTIKQIARVIWCLPMQDGRFCVGLKFQRWVTYADVQMIAKP